MNRKIRLTVACALLLMLCDSLVAQRGYCMPRLIDTLGQKTSLRKIAHRGPLVLTFMNASCPICQKHTRTLNELQRAFPALPFVVAFTQWTTDESLRAFAREYALQFPVFLDKKNRLARRIKATTTPEVFLFDARGRIVYSGAIDNWFAGLGKNRPQATAHYLRDAVQALLKGTDIPLKRTEPVGCILE